MIISAYLPEETVQQLTVAAKKAQISRNALLSSIVNEWLEKHTID